MIAFPYPLLFPMLPPASSPAEAAAAIELDRVYFLIGL